MNARQTISMILILLGGILAFLPLSGKFTLHTKPDRLLAESLDGSCSFTADQVARFIVNGDSTIQIIDLRTPSEYKQCNIPGSVNLPYNEFLVRDPEPYLNLPNVRNIFYSNGDINAGYALVLAGGLGYKNCFIMKGGLNEWFNTIMNSEYKGATISARDNALFEIRLKARRLFTEINSMPDSLKLAYIASKRFDPKKLDGGCE
jgi:rhodanese-related sulfurtransferase